MTRESKEHEARKNEIIHTSQGLFLKRGYDNTSVQDIIDAMNIAKGTFYHYFKSKDELLDAIVDHITTEMFDRLSILIDSDANAIDKFNELFRISSNFKTENIDVFMILINTLYRDENITLRNRVYENSLKKNGPLISRIVRQGIEEKLFNTSYPDDIAMMMITIGKELNETIIKLIIDAKADPEQLCMLIIDKFKMYQDVIERILGADPGSLKLYSPQGFKDLIMNFIKRGREDKKPTTVNDRYRLY